MKSSETPGWDLINKWGREYYRLVQRGYGKSLSWNGEQFVNDDRSKKQKRLANETVTGTVPYIRTIADAMLYGPGGVYSRDNKNNSFSSSIPKKNDD